MTPHLGCIADDFTGATDLANTLTRSGMRTIQMIGVPTSSPPNPVDAVVIALKSRTVAPELAVRESLAALAYLQFLGCQQFYFKYCSTFDSTDRGNIGPVTDAMMTALDVPFTIACPAFPQNKRTIYKGYLFAGDVLLNESGMQNHPLTPMRDANLVRVLQLQTSRTVGLISIEVVRNGVEAFLQEMARLQKEKVDIAIVDALSSDDLITIGAACSGLKLLTAGSGVAQGVAVDLRKRNQMIQGSDNSPITIIEGARAVLSGSCSTATQAQVAAMIAAGAPTLAIDPLRLAQAEPVVQETLQWAAEQLNLGPILIYATADRDAVRSVQSTLGVDEASKLVEDAFGKIALGLVELGVRQMIVAGGETSGAVTQSLQIEGMYIGPQIAPGVPWTTSIAQTPLNLALKSGNFGSPDFFLTAWDALSHH
jgi:uncharacterized protein YgbK (DUF1537 family)